jgi:zinc transporter ZupT
MLKLSLILGAIAALADVAGGFVLVRAQGVERYLRYFVALGAGFLMATALLEMTPEGLKLNPRLGRGADHGAAIAWCICWSTPSTPTSTLARRRIRASLSAGTPATR